MAIANPRPTRTPPQPSLKAVPHSSPPKVLPAVKREDFYAYSPSHSYIYTPTRETWSVAAVDSRLKPVATGRKTKQGEDEYISASRWLDQNRAVEQMSWQPGAPMIIQDKLIAQGGWFAQPGARCFNLYQPPQVHPGNPDKVQHWLDHIKRVYPDDLEHIIRWLAHRVQRPQEKINHALVLGGSQGIGKDTLLEPVKYAVGPWNFIEIGPHHLLGRFNGFVRSIILRISEARDLGDVDRYSFYERLKVYTATPPDVIRVDEKNLREYSIPNLCGVILTTNHPDGIYLPPDDRRHYVTWSDCVKEDFKANYWRDIHAWYQAEGNRNVAAYLATYDLSNFDAKAPPPQTEPWQRIVDSDRAPEDAELADIIDELRNPEVLTLETLLTKAVGDFEEWLEDRKNRRIIPRRLETAGYIRVRNDTASDGLWKLKGKRQAIYGRRDLTVAERLSAAKRLK